MSSGSKNAEPMTCAAVEEHLSSYLGDDPAAEGDDRLARHVMVCPRCAAEVALAERVELELAALPAFDAPPELIARIKSAARREPATVWAWAKSGQQRFLRPAALAAALLAALAIGWWQSGRGATPSAAEIAAAEQEARYALALVARIGRKASAEVRDEVFIERVAVPVLKGVGRPFNRSVAPRSGGLKS